MTDAETGVGAIAGGHAGGGTSGDEVRWAAKLVDDGLRRLATQAGAGAGAGLCRVLIEVATPRPQVKIGTVPRGGRKVTSPVRVVGAPSAPSAATPGVAPAEEVGRLLQALSGTQPVWLEAAQSFVAEVTSEQLRAVARSPFVRAIHLNRQLG